MRLTKESKEFLANVFKPYAEVELSDALGGSLQLKFEKQLIVHMYATGDTKNDGYNDALWFTAKLYDVDKKTVCTIEHRDAITFEDVRPSSVRIFKDGSTCLVIYGPVKVGIFQALSVSKG